VLVLRLTDPDPGGLPTRASLHAARDEVDEVEVDEVEVELGVDVKAADAGWPSAGAGPHR
jgi:hypothetical protein